MDWEKGQETQNLKNRHRLTPRAIAACRIGTLIFLLIKKNLGD
jgi:hypothetical protein